MLSSASVFRGAHRGVLVCPGGLLVIEIGKITFKVLLKMVLERGTGVRVIGPRSICPMSVGQPVIRIQQILS